MKYAWKGKPLYLADICCDSCVWNWINFEEFVGDYRFVQLEFLFVSCEMFPRSGYYCIAKRTCKKYQPVDLKAAFGYPAGEYAARRKNIIASIDAYNRRIRN